MSRFIFIFFLLQTLLFSCRNDQLSISELDATLEKTLERVAPNGSTNHFILPSAGDYSQYVQDPKNPMTDAKVSLGKFLFYETGLAQDAFKDFGKATYSCSSCHVPEKGFMPGRVQGIADGGIGFGEAGEGRDKYHLYSESEMDVQGARPLSMLNVGFVTNSSWSGQFGSGDVNEGTEHMWDEHEATEVNHLGLSGLESQNIEGLKLHRMKTDKEIYDHLGYTALFDQAFPDIPTSERYNEVTTSFAISAYIRTLVPNEAPFQQWLKGDKQALSTQEKEGAVLFFSKAGCVNCHQGAGLNSNKFYALGVKDLYETGEAFNTDISDIRNMGRGGFTGDEADMFKFKVPQLYNLKNSPFYFHGSSKRSLEDVVDYFNEGVKENANVPAAQVSPLFHPLELSDDEKAALVAFLKDGLYDPDLTRYKPPYVLSGNCFPNNDILSRAQMGCD